MKIVITGGPCSGKSTTIEQLGKLGYNIVSEVALELIEEENAGDNSIYPWTNAKKFQSRVNRRQIQKENSLDDKINILDRSIIDSVAFMNHYKIPVPKYVETFAIKSGYDMIFILEMLPEEFWYMTKKDKPRMHPYSDGVQIHNKILTTYKQYGYEPIIVPFDSVNNRTMLIHKEINKKL